jgi:predicted molibdopterin-dependent oxidoreductase YjgC
MTPSYAGITYERLGLDGLQWPCPTPDHPGTVYLHKDKFTRGKGKFHAIEYLDPAEMPDGEYPYFLSTGRNFAHFHTGTMTRVSPHLHAEQKTGYVEISQEDANKLAVVDGDMLKLSTRRWKVEVAARVTAQVRPGNLYMPFHFSEAPANMLTNPVFDPIAKIPEYKVCAASVQKAING